MRSTVKEELPVTFDWTALGKVTSVKNQGKKMVFGIYRVTIIIHSLRKAACTSVCALFFQYINHVQKAAKFVFPHGMRR